MTMWTLLITSTMCFFVARSNPNARVLAIVPDTCCDYPRNAWLASEFYIKLRRRREEVPSNLTILIVVHGGLIKTYWMQYKVLYLNYSGLVNIGFAVPSRKMDLNESIIECGRRPTPCAALIRTFVSKVRQELGNNVPIHLRSINKRTLTALGDFLRHVYSFDNDTYRRILKTRLRRKDLDDKRSMITTSTNARKWASEWLGELVKYVDNTFTS